MNLTRLEGILSTVVSMSAIIPFLLKIFVGPLIKEEMAKLTIYIDKVVREHLRYDHRYYGGSNAKPGNPSPAHHPDES